MPPEHVPPEQPHVPSDPQVMPQPPQLLGSLDVFDSHPLEPFLSQSLVPPVQLVHVPALQYSESAQMMPQPPQLLPSEAMLVSHTVTGLPSHSAVSPLQPPDVWHTPPMQTWPPVHGLLQPPQWLMSVLVFTSQPLLCALPSQLAKPLLQLIWHAPRLHDALPLLLLQTMPQPPQALTAVCVFVSQPLVWLLSQLPQPVSQLLTRQFPVEQVSVALSRLHTLPQLPQCESDVRLASQPLLGLPSQLS